MTVAKDRIKTFTRGGASIATFKDENVKMISSGITSKNNENEIIFSTNDYLYIFDINTNHIVRQISFQNEKSILKMERRLYVSGKKGEIAILDPRSYRLQQSHNLYKGGICDFDVKDNLLVTCGFSLS